MAARSFALWWLAVWSGRQLPLEGAVAIAMAWTLFWRPRCPQEPRAPAYIVLEQAIVEPGLVWLAGWSIAWLTYLIG